MQVEKCGNSLAVRIPALIVDPLQVGAGCEINLHVAGTGTFGVAPTPEREEWLTRLRAFRGRLPADFKFDRDKANAG